jgi:hypothetical protein
MSKDFENFAVRAAPTVFVVLWSTGFIGTKYVLRGAEPPISRSGWPSWFS